MHDDFKCFAGIDWATEAHQVCLMDRVGAVLGERSFAHSGAGLADLCDWLVATGGVPPAAIAVAIEVPHGAVVDSLLERGFATFSLNPKQLDRFRDRFTVAGAKDDSRDAHVLGDSLRTDRHCFRHLEADAPVVVELREWSRMAEELAEERVRFANRLREQLRKPWRSRTTSPPSGSSTSGRSCRRPGRPAAPAGAASPSSSRPGVSARSMPRACCASCARRPSPSPP